MNYYDELLDRIQILMDSSLYDEADALIMNELNVPYIPRDVEQKLLEFKEYINSYKSSDFHLSDEDIASYLSQDESHQLLAVNELNSKNLRDHIALCQKYLNGNGSSNGKALLIDSLVRQEIDHVFTVNRNDGSISFNPREICKIEDSEGCRKATELLEETFMKEPSKLLMARQLLAKELLLLLPASMNEEEGTYVAEKITDYINDAFGEC